MPSMAMASSLLPSLTPYTSSRADVSPLLSASCTNSWYGPYTGLQLTVLFLAGSFSRLPSASHTPRYVLVCFEFFLTGSQTPVTSYR